ncbi:MAG: GNAT family N-acetyltransferase [Cytophagales bacterium]|nr:GNAT family N-acetyltransferase [Armatimonadota bacterium]
MPPFNVRPFDASDADYAVTAAVWNAAWPDYPETAGELRHSDENRDPKVKWARFIARTETGTGVGIGMYNQSSGMYHPNKFGVDITVAPESQGQGIGAALYERILDALAMHAPIALLSDIREDGERARRFVETRGFVPGMREQESRLDLSTFDPDRFAEEIARADAQNIVLKTARELRDSDPGFYEKSDDLFWTIAQDIPHPEPPTRPPQEVWRKRFEDPNFLWDGNIVALSGDEYIGVSVLWTSQGGADLYTGTTGVLREYRKRGIASALKVRALSYAKTRGAAAVRTWNEENNAGMLGINYRLGFVKQPAWICYTKTLATTEGAGAAE